MSDEDPWDLPEERPDIDAFRTLTVRHYHALDYTEVEADDSDPITGMLDLMKLGHAVADDHDYAMWLTQRGIPGRRQAAFRKVVLVIEWMYVTAHRREPTLEELTRGLRDLFPEMDRDEMFDRLRQVAEEVHA